MIRLTRIEPKKFALVTAFLSFCIGLIQSLLTLLIMMFSVAGDLKIKFFGLFLLFIGMVFAYIFFGYIFGFLIAKLYNFFSGKFGGIELELEQMQ